MFWALALCQSKPKNWLGYLCLYSEQWIELLDWCREHGNVENKSEVKWKPFVDSVGIVSANLENELF